MQHPLVVQTLLQLEEKRLQEEKIFTEGRKVKNNTPQYKILS
jgi:hypothetical protein